MIHEATHQLNAEVAGFRKAKWIDEGLATYFGTSRVERGRLVPGKIDPDTYPIWWLLNSGLTGSLDADIEDGRYADAYKRLIIEGGSLENFERIIGPADKIEYEWYRYLQTRMQDLKPQSDDAETTAVIWSQH
jgi:hypothetical protein